MDTVDPTRFFLAFIFVLGLIGVMWLVLRYVGKINPNIAAGMMRGKNENARIKIVETCYIDSKRRLVLARCDDVEHLLLLADGREQVIESFDASDTTADDTL